MFKPLKYGFLIFGGMMLFVNSPLFAQNATVSRFTAAAVAEKVLLDWVVAAGATCDGIGIYRGTDTVGMTLIHFIPGVCGDLARPVTYAYLDSFPAINQKNYYRLELGARVFTAPVSISLVNVGEIGYQFRPHPVTNVADLYLQSDNHLNYTLHLYDYRGQLRLTTTFTGNNVSFNVINFENGMYLFTLISQDGSTLRRGKMLVQR